jgi:hypothetical protein
LQELEQSFQSVELLLGNTHQMLEDLLRRVHQMQSSIDAKQEIITMQVWTSVTPRARVGLSARVCARVWFCRWTTIATTLWPSI